MLRKAKCVLAHTYFLSLANMACSTLARQLEAVINEVSMAQVLRLRTNPWRVHKVKHLPPTKVTYSLTKFHSDQPSYLYLHLLNLQFFKTTANLMSNSEPE